MAYFEIFKAVLFSAILIFAMARWVNTYIDFQLNKRVSNTTRRNHQSRHFRILGKVIFVLMNLITLISFWHNSNWFLSIEPNDWYRLLGILMIGGAASLYLWAVASRAKDYFAGPYAYVRHPIYLANLLLGLGFCFASGSIWIFFMAIYGSFEIVQTMNREEASLRLNIPEYQTYQGQTKKILPFVF